MQTEIVMATNNAHKLQEVRQILGDAFHILSLAEIGCHDDIPETAHTIEGNALLKARYVYMRYGISCFADDTGLEVDALNGEPGVYTARYGQMHGFGVSHDADANIRCLLHRLEGQTRRTAHFRTAIALILHGEEHLFEGCVDGVILPECAGEGGFGYDPVFSPLERQGISFAQLSAEDKNSISHRGRAIQAMVGWLHSAPPALLS